MKELAILLASVMPIEDLIKTLKGDLEKYEADPSEENLKKVHVACMLLLSKASIDHEGGGVQGATKVMEDMANIERAHNLLTPEKN